MACTRAAIMHRGIWTAAHEDKVTRGQRQLERGGARIIKRGSGGAKLQEDERGGAVTLMTDGTTGMTATGTGGSDAVTASPFPSGSRDMVNEVITAKDPEKASEWFRSFFESMATSRYGL